MKRLLSCVASEMLALRGAQLKQSILASEGRTVLAETYGRREPLLGDITNAELAAAFGADLILLNGFDCFHPEIFGLPESMADDPVRGLESLCGRLVGANLEPVDESAGMMEARDEIAAGRKASAETFEAAEALGLRFVCLTGNPGTGVTNAEIEKAIRTAKAHFSGLIFAGKMHAAGVDEPVIDLDTVRRFMAAGADVILLPMAGTVPGLSEEEVREACRVIRAGGCLSLTAIGTAQESADTATVRELALCAKRCGADIQHIGDAGWGGLAFPENIQALSVAIRGVRHTYFKMAQSARR